MKNTRIPTSHIAPFGLRMQEDLRQALESEAQANGRSLNAEIIARLQFSIENKAAQELPDSGDLSRYEESLRKVLREEIRHAFLDQLKVGK